MKSGSLVIIIMSTPGNSSMQSLSVLIHFPNGERPVDKEDEAKTDVGKEFARFLQANSDIVGSVFTEQVLSRNTKLESDNKQLWKLVWKEYGPEQLRQAIVRYNVKGWTWHCDCTVCMENASPKPFPPFPRTHCGIRIFIKMAIHRAGLSFSARSPVPVGESVPARLIPRGDFGHFATERVHMVFGDIDNVYSIVYGAKIMEGMDRMDPIVFGKIQALFRMLRERQHHTYTGSN